MYFQGLFRGYQAIWSSTFITSEPSVTAFVHLLFGPSLLVSNLLGLGLAYGIDIGRLLSPQGDRAAARIHLFAITVMITIVAPRAALAAWRWRSVKRGQQHVALRLDPYYGGIIEAPVRALIEKEVANETTRFSEDVATFVGQELYDERIVPRLRRFRTDGGKVSELRSEIQSLSAAFAPQIESYVVDTRLPELQRTLSQRVGEILMSLGTDFTVLEEPQAVLRGMTGGTGGSPDMGLSRHFTSAIGLSIGTSIALAVATVSGGLGKCLGKEKVVDGVEGFHLPAVVVRTTLWESRFQRLADDGRQKCRESVRAEVEERLKALQPRITEEILVCVRRMWQG